MLVEETDQLLPGEEKRQMKANLENNTIPLINHD
jgi:hypothetical protein